MPTFFNGVRQLVSGTPGAGDVTLGAAATGFQTFASAGAANGDADIPVRVEDASNAWELSRVTYSTTGPSLTGRSLVQSSSGSLLSLTSAAIVMCDVFASDVGYREVPQNSKSAAYTLVLSDNGKHILHPAADTTARIFTIPANSSVAFPIGATITFVNQNAGGVITIAITTDTMRLSGAGTTGSRTLAANGIATALKITSTEWIISGTGLT